MTRTSRSIATSIGLIAVALLHIGCTDKPTGTVDTTQLRVPGVGSTFTFTATQYDSTGAVLGQQDVTFTVAKSGLHWQGRHNVALMTVPVPGLDTLAFSYDANGDLSTLYTESHSYGDVTFGLENAWTPIATVNRERNRALIAYDSTAIAYDSLTRVRITRTGGFDGDDTQTVGGASLATVRSIFEQNVVISGGDVSTSYRRDSAWLAPTIGMYTRLITRHTTTDDRGNDYRHIVYQLKSYVLK